MLMEKGVCARCSIKWLSRTNFASVSLENVEDKQGDMYAKLLAVLALAAVAAAREYPAGVHPAVCPNYPYCDVGVLARFTPDGQPIPEWVSNPGILPVAPRETPTVPRYPAGLNPAECPGYPYCW